MLAAARAAAHPIDRWAFGEPAARPTDPKRRDPDAYSTPEARRSPACAGRFCVHWVARGKDAPDLVDENGIADGDGVPDYVERVLEVGAYVHTVENERMGWREPHSDGRRGGHRGKTDVYLKELSGKEFGYATIDRREHRGRDREPPQAAYLVLDNDFEHYELTPAAALEVTFAHEYCHVLQFGYEAEPDKWFAESIATWMEDQVYDGINDYRGWARGWARLDNVPLTANLDESKYGAVVWNQWLTRRYGRRIIRNAWSRALHTRPKAFSVTAYDSAIRAAGDSDFSRDFASFAADVAEWRTGTDFPEGRFYLDAPRRDSLPRDGRPLRRSLNHTTFRLLRVHAHRGRAVVAYAVAPRGISAGLALVGRTGGERGGDTVTKLRFKRYGGKMIVRLGHPGRFKRITAVLINADAEARGFDFLLSDWNYLADSVPFLVGARSVP